MRYLRPAVPLLLSLALASCESSTAPAIELVTVPGTFSATLSGGLRETVQGSAIVADAFGAGSGLRVTMDASGGGLQLRVLPGALSSQPYYEFPVGVVPLNGFPGSRTVDAEVTLAAVGPVPEATFYAVNGSFEVLESTPTKILAQFDFEAIYVEGLTTDRIRVRGSFWAVP